MPARNLPPVGHVNCRHCGERCSVHQQESKNAYFYTRFCSCDPKNLGEKHPTKTGMTTLQNQLKNPSDQQYILDNLELMAGQQVRMPPHLSSVEKAGTSARASEWQPVEERERLKPDVKPETEPSSEPGAEPKKSGKGWLFGGLGVAFLSGVALIIKGVV